MNITRPTRRRFLNSMVVLAAGAAFRPASDIFCSVSQGYDLEKEWAAFWKHSGGTSFENPCPSEISDFNEMNSSHKYCCGHAIFFQKENLVALPTWIYWKLESRKPSDMYITFFEQKDGGLKRTIVYNHYEMEAIYKSYKQLNQLSFIKNSTPEIITIKTKISVRKLKQELRYFREKEILFTNYFTYNI